jgi:hypothetical protein
VQKPVPYFHSPENRIISALVTLSIGGIVQLYKNPKIHNFITACAELADAQSHDKEAVVSLATVIENLATEIDVPLHFDISYLNVKRGERLTL